MVIGVITTVPVHSVSIITKIVSSTTSYGEVYSIQHYVIKIDQRLAAGRWLIRSLMFPSLDLHGITEMLLNIRFMLLRTYKRKS